MSKLKKMLNFKTVFSAVIVVLLVVVVTILTIRMNNPVYNDDYFKTDGSKIVLLLNSQDEEEKEKEPIKTYIVYYYSDDTITDIKQFYQFESNDIANEAMKDVDSSKMGWVKGITINGPYVIFTLADDQYEGITTTQVRDMVENSEDTESDNTEGADSSEEDNDPEGAVNPE